MPTYKKASLAKKPKATKKTPLSKRPVKKVPIKKKALGATKLSTGNEVVKLGEGYKARTSANKKKRPNATITSEKKPKLFAEFPRKAYPVEKPQWFDVTGKPVPAPPRKPVKAKAKKKATKPKSRGGR